MPKIPWALEIFIEILKIVVPFLLGGGGTWLVLFRRKRQQLEAQMDSQQYQDYTQNLDSYVDRLHKLSMQLSDLIETNHQLHLRNRQLEEELRQARQSQED